MKVWKKFSAVALALVMVLALGVSAFADDPDASDSTGLTDGAAGGYITADTPNLNTKVVNIQKEIKAFNPDETIIYGPAITYTYTVTPASGAELVKITDDATNDHANGVAVETTALAGVTTGVTVNAGEAGTNTSAVGTLAWTNNDLLTAAADGAANTKTFSVDFTDVVFTAPGVYRYKIEETAVTSGKDYAASGVEDKNSNVRYLDVYVMRSDNYDVQDITKDDWTIYGYVCVEEGTTAITKDTTKTNGFVGTPDEYRTYNLTLKKTLTNDTSMQNHQFPFTVAFANTDKTGTFQLIAEKSESGVTVTTTNAPENAGKTLGGTNVEASSLLKIGNSAALSAFSTDVTDLTIAHNNTIKFIGIPNGTTVTVTETNNVIGTTYSTSATQKVGTADATGVIFSDVDGGGTIATDNKSVSIDKGEKAQYQGGATADNTNVEIEFTNLLAIISPTGVTLRYAPYLAMLGAGVVALPLTLRKKEELF